jgi:hypothetical protein
MRIRCRGKVFTQPFPSSGLFLLIKNMLPSNVRRTVVCIVVVAYKRMSFSSRSLATAVSLAAQFLL